MGFTGGVVRAGVQQEDGAPRRTPNVRHEAREIQRQRVSAQVPSRNTYRLQTKAVNCLTSFMLSPVSLRLEARVLNKGQGIHEHESDS